MGEMELPLIVSTNVFYKTICLPALDGGFNSTAAIKPLQEMIG